MGKPTALLREIDRRAEPFDFGGGPQAALLIHGFTGAPAELRPVGELLSKEFGFRVLCPLLPGHGTTYTDLENYGSADWKRTVVESWASLKKDHADVHLVGLSMGALLCLDLFRDHPADFRSLTLLVPAVFMRTWFQHIASCIVRYPLVYRLVPPVAKETPSLPDHVAYDYYPPRASGEFARVFLKAQEFERMDSPPTLIVTSKADEVVHPKTGLFLLERLSNPLTRLVELERSTHVVTIGSEKERLFAELRAFFREISPIQGHTTKP